MSFIGKFLKMKRKIINIIEEKCNGCALCIPECKEGAIQIIDGKARLISDLFCDGLGACLGYCPEGAIIIEEREAEPYNERLVIESISAKTPAVLKAHLEHLIDHNDRVHYNEAVMIMEELGIANPISTVHESRHNNSDGGGCPGSKIIQRTKKEDSMDAIDNISQKSELNQWPVQLHLVSPNAPYFYKSELVIMSTCGPIASADIHQKYLRNRTVVVACPKLDYTAPYTEKLAEIFTTNEIPKVIVVIMEVPCCRGLSKFAQDALQMANAQNMILEEHIMGLDGSIIKINKLN